MTILKEKEGRIALVRSGPHQMKVRIETIQADEYGWRAVLCCPDNRKDRWTIGPFAWDDKFAFTVTKDYWHFPLLSERYCFDDRSIAYFQSIGAK